jgi:hypothetical protein
MSDNRRISGGYSFLVLSYSLSAQDQGSPDPGQIVERWYIDNLPSDRFHNRQDSIPLLIRAVLQADQQDEGSYSAGFGDVSRNTVYAVRENKELVVRVALPHFRLPPKARGRAFGLTKIHASTDLPCKKERISIVIRYYLLQSAAR